MTCSAPRDLIRDHPRVASALAFGTATAMVTHFAWISTARMSGVMPLLSIGAGLVHAVAGAALGRRLMDPLRTRSASEACLLGARISLLAQLVFSPPFAFWIYSENVGPWTILSYLWFTVLVAVFAFLAVGWALLVVSMGIAWAVFRLTPQSAVT